MFVGCPGETQFYGSEASEARNLTIKLANEDCNKDEELGRPERGSRLRPQFCCSGPPRLHPAGRCYQSGGTPARK